MDRLDLPSIPKEKVFAMVCAQCHGSEGEGNLDLKAPSIAGLPEWYVVEQGGKFRNGVRGTHPADVAGIQMRSISLLLSEEQFAGAARTSAKLNGIPTRQAESAQKEDVDQGRFLYANRCMECHRYNGKGEVVFHSPPLTTLNAEYLQASLLKYREGLRGSGEGDFYGAKMLTATTRLTDEEITRLVCYIGELAHGDDPRPARER